ncbi:Diadenosine tetraphosphate (Ap4A) hydrolase [Rhodoblastus acidophilus]|uniref:Diadenosine tetraphosphate (Ap4A) hydrolase n=1 Tax=Rhodoblastus acidophilus TaxID=1074 RepID=A0A212S1V0_RHOAC|nr:HIT family protein [Rhodoblastus acidophilus]MCW2315949.1 diadenosine tetraphosphate (Ap4A) HIT family hydrolase [Rhodoblastus acidophilus]PPQ38178.1 HIT domain-containing protein [Rhodoblastus acidophilus]RAI16482.1 HIT domain-containing protein [Rhodoblastus acidophilus]SNB78950.1 Diadenosine tetraphosphate (Ap4A) hydrolase [Rhodoblastus acidophilus]
MTFALDPRLEADTILLGDMALSRVLLMNDSRFPWLILVPRREGLVEITDMTPFERRALFEEAALAADRLKLLTGAKKINLGALGNVVPQLHVHVVARFEADAAWPGPVWGAGAAIPYDDPQPMLDKLRPALTPGV